MATQLDAKFFRKAKKLNRAVEITDNQAFIPAVKDSPEIRVPLPNRRLKTNEERTAELTERMIEIAGVEQQIEVERKALLELVTTFKTGGPASEVVAQNLKVKALMEKRSSLARPAKWIEELDGLSFKDVFASKRDDRKIGAPVYQVKRRVEPIISLYVDLAAEAVAAEPVVEAPELPAAKVPKATVPKTSAEAAQGAIIGQKKRTVIKLGKPPTGAPPTGAPGPV
jgi:hypothetical protein